jgi:prevent-host-death family protein
LQLDAGGIVPPQFNLYYAQYIAQYSVSTFGGIMGISVRDVVAFSQARANLSDLAEQVKAGAEKIITKNGESYVALIDSDRLDYYHRLERERIHLLLIDEASIGLDDVAAGRVEDARQTIQRLKRKRAA